MHRDTGEVIRPWGDNFFYLPHMMSIDKRGNYWLTDVATHQVFMFEPSDLTHPKLTLGTKMEPGRDDNHFCSPTAVEVNDKGDEIFISYGYCNKRVLKYQIIEEPNGDLKAKKAFELGHKDFKQSDQLENDDFSTPHGLAIHSRKSIKNLLLSYTFVY